MKKAKRSVVYFIRSCSGSVKIGRTSNLSNRMWGLRGSSSETFVLMGTIPGGVELEKQLHARFASCRTRNEWFVPSAEMIVEIDALLSGVAATDEVACEPCEIDSYTKKAAEWARLVEDRTARVAGLPVLDVRASCAARVGLLPGIFENLRKDRVAEISATAYAALRKARMEDLLAEMAALKDLFAAVTADSEESGIPLPPEALALAAGGVEVIDRVLSRATRPLDRE